MVVEAWLKRKKKTQTETHYTADPPSLPPHPPAPLDCPTADLALVADWPYLTQKGRTICVYTPDACSEEGRHRALVRPINKALAP